MPPPATPRADPTVAILRSEAALFSLKRPQLVSLAKEHGLKAGGKNIDLIQRLQDYSKALDAANDGEDDSMVEADESHASWAVLREDAVPEQEVLAEFGVQATISASSSSSSLASTLRSAGAAVLRAFADPPTASSKALVAAAAAEEPATSASAEPSGPLTVPSLYPSLDQAFESYPHPRYSVADSLAGGDYSTEEVDDEGGIRMVSSRSTVHSGSSPAKPDLDEKDAPPVPPLPAADDDVGSKAPTPAYIFGSPVLGPTSPPPAFSFSMPGSLFSSTSSSNADVDASAGGFSTDVSSGPPKSAAELVFEEMNRRAAEARAASGGPPPSSLQASTSTLRGAGGEASGSQIPASPSKIFGEKHKRAFAQMDSIVNHYAAKRPHPSTSASSTNLAGMARSASSRTLAASTSTLTAEERAPKRLKPSTSKPSGLNRLPSSSSSKKLVDGLRAAGWSAAPAPSTSVSLSASILDKGTGKGKEKAVREDLKPVQEREREARKRQLEMAKARRKSQAAIGAAGLAKRRPSLGVGPKPAGSTASRFFKSTIKKLTPSTSSSSISASTRPDPAATAVAASTSTTVLPRFASSTASSRAVATGSVSSIGGAAKKQPGWKKFDLQESLKRPMSWKASAGASSLSGMGKAASSPAPTPSSSRPSSAFAPPSSLNKRPPTLSRSSSTTSLRVANAALLGAVKPSAIPEEPAASPPRPSTSTPVSQEMKEDDPLGVAAKLAALPTAPAGVFGLPPPAFLAASSSSSSTPFQPVTNAALSPSSAAKPSLAGKKPSSAVAGAGKKTASSATRLARGGDKAAARKQVEGLESKARRVQAKAKAGKGMSAGERPRFV
ncbi:hypothetical protein JCM8097_005003 [Rhodosporidiobolus ruineniae]